MLLAWLRSGPGLLLWGLGYRVKGGWFPLRLHENCEFRASKGLTYGSYPKAKFNTNRRLTSVSRLSVIALLPTSFLDKISSFEAEGENVEFQNGNPSISGFRSRAEARKSLTPKP